MWHGKKSTSGSVGFAKLLLSVIVVALVVWIVIATHPSNGPKRVNWNYVQTVGR